MSITHQQAAQEMLDAVETFMSGREMTAAQDELQKAVFVAGCYASAAYDAHQPKSGGEAYALTRAFLSALIDPLSQDLDYLRADPASGAAAREARRKGGDA